MFTTIKEMVLVARPLHWVKNFSVFAALLFSGNLFVPQYVGLAFWAFMSFNLISSATYILNDMRDVKHDRLHPIKKNRPLAAGRLSEKIAVIQMIVLVVLSLFIAYTTRHPLFVLSICTYFLLQIAYSFALKNQPTIDILAIAAGFIIRIYAGAFVIDAHLSVWFLLCVVSVALFLASGKRRAELNILERTTAVTRKSLTKYSKDLLNSYVTMFANAAWMSWALFTFHESPQVSSELSLFLSELSKTTAVSKLLMTTIPVVVFAIMRYESLIFAGKSEAPEKLFLTDKALIFAIATWTGLVMWVLYFAGDQTLPL